MRYNRIPKVTLIILLLVFLQTAHASILIGTVTDSQTGEPIPGVNVQVKGTILGSATDIDGYYEITGIKPGNHILQYSHVGYRIIEHSANLAHGTVVEQNVTLIEELIEGAEVVYTATKTWQLLKDVPIATELITENEIRQRGATTAAEALESEIGLDINDTFAGSAIMIQGVDPDKVLVLVDGNRMIGRVNGALDLDQISTSGVKQIEVVKGSVSTLYGSEAIGGVINIITDKSRQPFNMEFDIRGGGFTSQLEQSGTLSPNYSPSISIGGSHGKLTAQSSVRYHHNATYDSDPSTNHTEGLEEIDRWNGNLRLGYDLPGPTTLNLYSAYMDEGKNWVEDSGLQSILVSFDDRETNRRSDLSAEIVCTPAWAERYSIKAFRTGNYHLWEKMTRPTGRVKDFSKSEEEYTELAGQLTRKFGSHHRITFGADYYWWDIGTQSKLGALESSSDAQLEAWDGYLQDEIRTGRITLVPGLRYEQHEVYGANWSPRLSTMYEINKDLKARMSAGLGYRAPSSKELYFIFNHASAGYMVIGNEDLDPEKSRNFSVSLEHTYENKSVARLTLFHNDLYNLIDFDSVGVSTDYYTGIFQYNNIVSAWTRGIEVERGFKITPYVTTNLAYAFLETRNHSTGEPLIHRPKHTVRMDVTWSFQEWTVKAWGRYQTKMLYLGIYDTNDQASHEYTNPYSTWDLSVNRALGSKWSTYLKVDNIMDITNARYGPRIGREVLVGLRYRMGSL
ncbi:TonB-dependent receptor [bacterium]|nr:TonB-dependent receptor [bacterium]